MNAPDQVSLFYEIWLNNTSQSVVNSWVDGGGINHGFGIQGTITVTINPPASNDPCANLSAVCIPADLQAWNSKDSTDATTAKVTTIQPNTGPKQVLTTADIAAGYALRSVDHATSSGAMFTTAALNAMVVRGTTKDPNAVTFTAPKNWSGVITYQYRIDPISVNSAGVTSWITPTTAKPEYIGLLVFTIHPTLSAPDPIASDPGAKVTVPVLEQSIIGSKPFSNAACTFADTKNKTTLTGTGTISNKGGSKDPVFTPDAAFTGSVDLACTVQDKFGTVSNSVTVTITVGAPAPAPVAPTPACTNCDNSGKLVSTGGSLAAPMSSGLAAVVLLVAAGAGILVIRRRTALAG